MNVDKVTLEPLGILYEGFLYDVTDFADKHPGGNVIRYYTEKGEDEKQAIQQFHLRSLNKVSLMLKGFKERPISEKDYFSSGDSEKLKRHKALTDDFAKLFLEIKNEGLFEPSYLHVIFRLVQILAILFIALQIDTQHGSNIWFHIIACIITGIGMGQVGWLMHEGGHESLTGKPKLDRLI